MCFQNKRKACFSVVVKNRCLHLVWNRELVLGVSHWAWSNLCHTWAVMAFEFATVAWSSPVSLPWSQALISFDQESSLKAFSSRSLLFSVGIVIFKKCRTHTVQTWLLLIAQGPRPVPYRAHLQGPPQSRPCPGWETHPPASSERWSPCLYRCSSARASHWFFCPNHSHGPKAFSPFLGRIPCWALSSTVLCYYSTSRVEF